MENEPNTNDSEPGSNPENEYDQLPADEKITYCDLPIHTGKLEGVNNKIKVIKRKAYGFHDLRYFTLKIYQAFSN
jgi:transposase